MNLIPELYRKDNEKAFDLLNNIEGEVYSREDNRKDKIKVIADTDISDYLESLDDEAKEEGVIILSEIGLLDRIYEDTFVVKYQGVNLQYLED